MVVKIVFLLSILRLDIMDARQLHLETRGGLRKQMLMNTNQTDIAVIERKTNGRSCTELIIFCDWEDVY